MTEIDLSTMNLRVRPRLHVLQSTNRPADLTEYSASIEAGAPHEVEFRYFSWREVFRAKFDVFHVHWPEYLIRNSSRPKSFAQKLLFPAMLLRLRLAGIPIVRTLHNIEPHDSGNRIEGSLLRLFDRSTTVSIRLNSATKVSNESLFVTIPHGSYIQAFPESRGHLPVDGRILYFGYIRPYKGVDRLLSAFAETTDDAISLRLAGNSNNEALTELIETQVKSDPRVTAHLGFLERDDLGVEIAQASLIVLPYRRMHNSGALLMALSLNRQVLVPGTPANTLLAAEVGDGWIFLFDGELDGSQLKSSIDAAQLIRNDRDADARPNLSMRAWDRLGEMHYKTYVMARDSKRVSAVRANNQH